MTDTAASLIPHPATGEALDLNASTGDLARWADNLRELERQAKEVRDAISEELLHRMDRAAKWTLREDGFEIKGASPAPTIEWDVDQLRGALRELLNDGLIDEDAHDAALQVVVQYKPRTAGLNALRKLGGDIAERIAACGTDVEKPRRVSVKPVGRA